MKKVINITLICLMVSVFCSTTHYRAESTYDNDPDLLLIPYKKILENLVMNMGYECIFQKKTKINF